MDLTLEEKKFYNKLCNKLTNKDWKIIDKYLEIYPEFDVKENIIDIINDLISAGTSTLSEKLNIPWKESVAFLMKLKIITMNDTKFFTGSIKECYPILLSKKPMKQLETELNEKLKGLTPKLKERQLQRQKTIIIEGKIEKILKRKNCIYFIQSIEDGAIKIGYSTNPKSRLSGIQTGSPNNMRIIATMKGDKNKENELHRKFGKYRIRGEWFRPSKELLQFIINLIYD